MIITHKKSIILSTLLIVGVVSVTSAYAQEVSQAPATTDQPAPVENTSPADISMVTNPAVLAQQKQFLNSVIDTFLQYVSGLQTTITKRTDIFGPAVAASLLDHITQHLVVYGGYKNDIAAAQSSQDLRSLAARVYEFRTTEGSALKREVLGAYVAYFQRTTQQLLASRFQNVQNKIINAKNQGKDTTSVEKVFSGAVALMQKIDTTARQLQNALQDPAVHVSLDDVSIALEGMQKDVSSMYALFRKITIQGDEILELNKEENGIRGTFPAGNW